MHIQRKSDGVDEPDDVRHIATKDDDYDPMGEIGSSSVIGGGANINAIVGCDTTGRSRYYRNRAKNCIVTVNLPSRCPEIDPLCTQMRPVKLFIVDR